jgi:DNA polymerase III subunit alpha
MPQLMPMFTHLHVHSHYSLLDGLTKIKPLVAAAKKRGFTSLALTDTGAMYGAIEFYKACKRVGIKPIIGLEAYVAPRSRHDKESEQDASYSTIVLLAKNYDGYRSLMALSSIGHLEGSFLDVPRIDKQLLQEHAGNIIALSGGMTGQIPRLLHVGKEDDAKKMIKEYASIFGKDHFYLELQDHPAIEGQVAVNMKLTELGRELDVPLVVTRDVHYLESNQADAQDILRCISNGWKVSYTDREDFRHVDRSLNTYEDIASRFRHVPEAIENTGKIADRINIEIELDNWHFAPVDLPPDKTADDVLREQTYAYVRDYYESVTDDIRKRIEYELGIITKKGYSPYFLCVADYVRYAKANGIVESTRGSAAGSLVSYVLGITTVDPIRFSLPFERFLNPFRPSPPDIDTDFADDRREEMLEYIVSKYGADKVAQIITFGTMAARASVRDVGRALGLSYTFCDQVAKLIPQGSQGFPMTIDQALKDEPDLKKLYDTNPDVRRLLDLAKQVEGCARHTSIHAAGVVIAPTKLTDFTPIQRESGGEKITTQYEMKAVEAAGLLKNDFLGIRNLAILGNAVEIVRKTTGDDVDIYNLPLDDQKTFNMLARGETMGVFQLGGSGMTRWLKELRPNRIEDIMAMVALYRPGPMDSIPEYIHRKHHPETVRYADPRLEKILDASYGLLVYQDDVMLTAIELAGYDWMEADKFRKAMGKKIPAEMAKQKIKFYDGCRTVGKLGKKTIDELWQAIEPFAAYGFNKAHAASYGIVAYQTAYMKAHYPVQYMTAVLQAEAHDTDKVAAIVHECRRMNIEVLPPDISESFRNFAMVSKPGEPGRIRFGLTTIKHVGDHISDVIYKQRRDGGIYTSLENFLERVDDKDLNKKSLESLIQSGALDGFDIDRATLMANVQSMLFFIRQLKEKRLSNQASLFSGTDIALDTKVVMKQAAEATMDQKLIWEKTLLGLYISSHPFAEYEPAFRSVITPTIEVDGCERNSWVVVGGVVDAVQKKMTKKGSIMLFVTLQDMSGSLDLLVFPKTYDRTQSMWQAGSVVCVVGKTPKELGDNKVFVESVYHLSPDTIDQVKQYVTLGQGSSHQRAAESAVYLTLSEKQARDHSGEMKEVFAQTPGEHRVYVRVGDVVIKTDNFVAWSDHLHRKVEDVVGALSAVDVQS